MPAFGMKGGAYPTRKDQPRNPERQDINGVIGSDENAFDNLPEGFTRHVNILPAKNEQGRHQKNK